ncbi:hypothetical protein [Parvibium lacunae]|uniref:Uncharacterized protein n=1 Tax=Parvibium lacunae TaxID=1888893 RepID=A0A368L6Q3_9BURK|nr:hypothetical protein [Parvibium lacunae]RCS59242.1 hypothetical protein DU000_00365 [Parvibium lacunae]
MIDRTHYAPKTKSQFRISEHVIELRDVVWQIKNLAAIAITKKLIHSKDPEPTFNQTQPKLQINWQALLVLVFAMGFGLTYFKLPDGVILFFILSSALTYFFFSRKKLIKLTTQWETDKNGYLDAWRAWKHRKDNPPTIFGLILETASGSRSIIYSYNENQIREAHIAIKAAMKKATRGDIFVSIDSVNVGGDHSINNFDSEIMSQVIGDDDGIN